MLRQAAQATAAKWIYGRGLYATSNPATAKSNQLAGFGTDSGWI
jgi:hypothetical protein